MDFSKVSSEADSTTEKVSNMDTGHVSSFFENNDHIILLVLGLLVAFFIFRKALKFLMLIGIIAAGVYFFTN